MTENIPLIRATVGGKDGGGQGFHPPAPGGAAPHMTRRNLVLLTTVSGILAAGSIGLASSLGPALSHTGAPALGTYPAEPTCNDVGCHQGNPLNSNGSLSILGVPSQYAPGGSYTLTVQLSSTANQNSVTRRWGFELTAVSLSDGQGSGTFQSPTLLVRTGTPAAGNRPYVSHDGDTFQQGASSPVQWSFTWIAPAQDVGSIGFYAAGNAANGDQTNTGDFIYTASAIVAQAQTPVESVSWGRLKAGNLFMP